MSSHNRLGDSMLLQSKDHGDLLDIIDDLRSQGISRYVDLPQIVVCGDQSSGKSSVLEAVSGIQFPRKDNLCTRFATEVILRRVPEENTRLSIVPAPDRSEDERIRLSTFQRYHVELGEFELLVDEARAAMGLESEGRAFSNDILRVEVSGPSQPHLTLVDLPGLFQASNKIQSDQDAEAVTSLVLSYMKKRRSIILAVVSAKNDFANQIVTRYARELDPAGHRTLGIITKPDTLHAGSDSEKSFVELAENKDVVFRLGWHVLKNRGYETRHNSISERDDAEASFFSNGLWASIPRSQVGIGSLRPRLSTLLRDQILVEIPDLILDVRKGVHDCKETLSKLGSPRASLQEQRLYLLGVSQTFTTLIRSAVDGVYNDSFFGNAATDLGYKKRLRAVVQNLLLRFAQTMRQDGHAKHIVAHVTKKQRAANARLITREEFISTVLSLMQRSRGCELPGTYNPQIVRDLFFDQSQPWQSIVERYGDTIWECAMLTVDLVLDYSTDEVTATGLRHHVISPATDSIKNRLSEMIITVLLPHQRGHPITYNHYLTENMQKFRQEHQKRHLAKKLDDFFGTDHERGKTYCETRSFDVNSLLNSITHATISDMDEYACSEAIDCMRAYYKVAGKTLIDSFSVLAEERCLLQALPEVFSPKVVMGLDDVTVSNVAAETEGSKYERSQATVKLEVLEMALNVLRKLQRSQSMNSTMESELPDLESLPSAPEDEDVIAEQVTNGITDVTKEFEDVPTMENTVLPPEVEVAAPADDLEDELGWDLSYKPTPPSKKKTKTKKDASWLR